MNLKEKTTYKVDFDTQNNNGDTQNNNAIAGEHHSFLFSFAKNNLNKKIILIANKEKDDFLKTTTFEFDLIKELYSDCKKCKKFSMCNVFSYNQSFTNSNILYYGTVIFMIFRQIYNCEKYTKILEIDSHFLIYQNTIKNLKISDYTK